jgi:hypothetical protein
MPFKPTKLFFTKEELETELQNLKSIAAIRKKYNVSSSSSIIYYLNKYKIPYNKKVRNYGVNDYSFSIDTEETFYWAGFLAADGCISIRKNYNNRNLILTLGEKDFEHLIKFKKFVNSNHPIKERLVRNSLTNMKWSDRKTYTITIGSHQIVSDLTRFNIVPRKTFIYNFPNWLITHPLVHHFMRGYFDGDGCFGSVVSNSGRKLLQHIISIRGNRKFLKTFGNIICNNLHISNMSISKGGSTYQLCYGGNNLSKIVGEFLYKDANTFLERKHNLWTNFFSTYKFIRRSPKKYCNV